MTLTEVNMNVATYVKFDAISNVLVEMANVKPTRLVGEQVGADSPQDGQQAPPRSHPQHQLDTSFNVHITLGNALEQLDQQAAPKQTPALGKCRHSGFTQTHTARFISFLVSRCSFFTSHFLFPISAIRTVRLVNC